MVGVEQGQQATGEAGGEPNEIRQGVGSVLNKLTKRDGQVVLEHRREVECTPSQQLLCKINNLLKVNVLPHNLHLFFVQ